jgi:hypothetical protein
MSTDRLARGQESAEVGLVRLVDGCRHRDNEDIGIPELARIVRGNELRCGTQLLR